MSGNPLVSVLMTAYNREEYIAASIESVLASEMMDFELIIVDDCSQDGTVRIARDFAERDPRVRIFVNEQNLNDYPNRNRAAMHARGRYLKYLDSDDIMYPHCLGVMVQGMERFPEAVFGLCSVPSPATPYPVCLGPRDIYLEHRSGYGHFERSPGSAIIRTDAFRSSGGFRGLRVSGDTDLWLRLARTYPMVKLVAGLYWSRIHSGSETMSEYHRTHSARLYDACFEEALSHPDCPLSPAERAAFRSARRAGLIDRAREVHARIKRFFS